MEILMDDHPYQHPYLRDVSQGASHVDDPEPETSGEVLEDGPAGFTNPTGLYESNVQQLRQRAAASYPQGMYAPNAHGYGMGGMGALGQGGELSLHAIPMGGAALVGAVTGYAAARDLQGALIGALAGAGIQAVLMALQPFPTGWRVGYSAAAVALGGGAGYLSYQRR